MSRRLIILALTLLGVFAFSVFAGARPGVLSLIENSASAEERIGEEGTLFQQSGDNQQAPSEAIAAHGADKWHEAGFRGNGVKIGVIDFGFGGIANQIGAEVPNPKGIRCYYFSLNPITIDNYTDDIADCDNSALHYNPLRGAATLEAVYDIAPEAEYYIAAVSHFSFYHRDLKSAVDWMIAEEVDVILFSHVGAWSGPGNGTSPYPTSEINTLNHAVSSGITWISPAGDRALDTWSGIFTDTDSDNIHEFSEGVECNDVNLTQTNHPYQVQLRWNDAWGSAVKDLELQLVDKDGGQVVATSQKEQFAPNDPNELVDFTTPDTQKSYCLRLELKTPPDGSPVIVNMQSYGRHGLAQPSLYGSVTSPGESDNPGMLTVGAAAWNDPTTIRPFSSRGPMNNRTTKPDIVGADGAYSAVLGENWKSTAQAAAHVAGLAALVKQRNQNDQPDMITGYLKDHASSRPAEQGDLRQDPELNNTWGHGFAMLPDDVEGATPPSQANALETLKAYIEAAIEKYDAEGIDAVKEYYRTQASYHSDLDLRLLLLRDGTIEVNGTFVASEGIDLSGNSDILGVEYGEKIAYADDDGDVIEFLVVTDSSDNFTFRKRTAWAKRHDGLVFSSGWTDKETDVETNLFKDNKRLKAVGTAIKAGARLQSNGLFPTVTYYNTPESIDGEFYVTLGLPGGNIAADATMPGLVGTKISDLTASDDAELGQKIFALAEGEELWITHMWRNPVTGQEERKHTYATRVFGSYIITGYYDESPPPTLEPLDATKAYVNEAIRKYDEEGLEATKEYYQSRESIEEELGLYLLLLKGDTIEVNPVFPDARGTGISWRTDPLDRNYGKTLAEADEDGVVVEYLLPIPSDDYTFRKKTAWAIKHDGLVFSAGWTDRETDVESNLTKRQKAIGTVIKVRARMQSETVRPTIAYYRDSKSIDGEYYAILGLPAGSIIADATMPQLVGTQISDLQASDDPQLGQKISALQEGEYLWTTHMWPNPETGQEELKHTYAIRFFGFYIISGYYGEMPPVVDPLSATQAYVLKAIRAYREDPEEALAYYRSEESIVNDPPGLYLTLLDDDIIRVNPVFPSAEGTSISWRDDPLGNMYGARLAAADEDGLVVEYLLPVSSQDYTYRKKTAWAIRAKVPDIDNPGSEVSLVFSAGWLDLETDFESTFTEAQRAVGEVIEARARVQAEGAIATLDHYKSTESIDGEYYVWLAYPTGRIAADVTMPELEGTNIADAYPPEVAQKILRVQSLETRWVSHMWPNPETDQEELKHTYVTRFFGFYIISGYYDETPPVVGPRAAAQAYVEDAIRAYREDPEAAKEYYRSEASVDRENDLYLILLDGNEIIVNGGFRGVEGFDITGRVGVDAIGKEFGKELVAADENGTFVDYLIPDPLSNYTLYRKHTWAIRSDGLVFAAGSWDKSEDVESTLEPHEGVVAAIYEAAARLLTGGADGIRNLIQYYNSPESIDGERYVFIIHAATGAILADATMTREELATTRVTDLQASDDPDLGKKIAALQTDEEIWISHMWPNPVTGEEELKHTYVTEFQGLIFGSGYYGETPPGPEPKPTTEYQEVSSGANHVCALDVNGNIDCFGADDHGQATPPQGTFRAVSSGDDHTCAIREDGTLVCWGALKIDTK